MTLPMKSPEIKYTERKHKPLRVSFFRDGMIHLQKKRVGNVALFELGTSTIGCEVVMIRIAKPQKLPNGEMAPWREAYPSTGEFGTRGWYYMKEQLAEAEAKFDHLVQEERKEAKRG